MSTIGHGEKEKTAEEKRDKENEMGWERGRLKLGKTERKCGSW